MATETPDRIDRSALPPADSAISFAMLAALAVFYSVLAMLRLRSIARSATSAPAPVVMAPPATADGVGGAFAAEWHRVQTHLLWSRRLPRLRLFLFAARATTVAVTVGAGLLLWLTARRSGAGVGLLAQGWLVAEGAAGRITWVVDFAATGDPLYRAWRLVLPDHLAMSWWSWVLHGTWLVVLTAWA